MPDLTTDQLQRLTDARWQGEQALFTTAVAMLTERPALPDDLAGLVVRARSLDQVLETEFDTQLAVERDPYGAREAIEKALYLLRDQADAIEALLDELGAKSTCEAVSAAREPACAVVKPLVWVRSDYSSRSECGRYHGLHCESGFWASMGAREITSTSETREEFDAAAQADHEASILSAITLRTEAEVRAEALRKAAQIVIDNQDCSPWEISDAILATIPEVRK